MFHSIASDIGRSQGRKSVAALMAGLLAFPALSMMSPTASAANPQGNYQQSCRDGGSVGDCEHEGRAINSSLGAPRGYWVYIPVQQYQAPQGVYVGDSEHQQP